MAAARRLAESLAEEDAEAVRAGERFNGHELPAEVKYVKPVPLVVEEVRSLDEEDDDHIQFHEPAPELPDLDMMMARAPLVRDAAPLGILKQQARETFGMAAAADGRRLQDAAPTPMLWSNTATWNGNAPPTSATTAILYVANGTHIVLDTSVYIRIWVIEGTLEIADTADIQLDAEAIIINSGVFRVGSAAAPFQNNAIINLRGHWQSP